MSKIIAKATMRELEGGIQPAYNERGIHPIVFITSGRGLGGFVLIPADSQPGKRFEKNRTAKASAALELPFNAT